MKIPILIFCLTVIFANISCRIYSEKNVNLIEGTADNKNHDTSYFNVPLRRSLMRYKRASILSPMTQILRLVGIDSNLINTILQFADFITGLLTGQENLCPTREKISIDMIEKLTQNPIQMIKTIFCMLNFNIGPEGRALTLNLLKIIWKFLRFTFLPGLHIMLNEIAKTGILPPNLRVMVETFNAFYNMLKFMGYVE